MANSPTLVLPKHAFVGEEVDLLVNYVPDVPATVRFRIELMPSQKVLEVHDVDAPGTPARMRWTVTVPQFTVPPVEVRFTAILTSLDMSLTSSRLTVHPTPLMSIWAGHALAKEAKPGIEALINETIKPGGTSALFDVSALATIRPQAADPRLIEWDTEIPQAAGGDNVKRRARFKEVIDFAHSKGVRVLAGYEAVEDTNRPNSPNAKLFMAFVQSAVVKKGQQEVINANGECEIKEDVVKAHVDAIGNFLYTDPSSKLDWDGIGFDIEIGALHARYRSVIRALYQGLAQKHPDKLLTFACFGFTAPGRGRNGAPVGQKFFETQSFDLCRGHSNIIARTMLYEEVVDQPFVEAINKFAFGPAPAGVGLQRHQVQQGFQGDLQPGQASRPAKITDNTEIIPMIQKVLRPDACGLIYFALFASPATDTARMKFFPTLDETYRKKP
jgi:hypothetical protein